MKKHNEIIKQKKVKNKSLLQKVLYELLEVRGIKRPVVFFGLTEYRRIRSFIQRSPVVMHTSQICWLAKKFDVTPQFIVNIVRRSNLGEEGYNLERFNQWTSGDYTRLL